MSLSKQKINIANIAIQYLSNIQNITNASARAEALKLIVGTTDTPIDQLNFGQLFRIVFDEIEASCSETKEVVKSKK